MATMQTSPPSKAMLAAANQVLMNMPEQTSCLVLRESVEKAGIYGIGITIQRVPPHSVLAVDSLLGPEAQNFNLLVNVNDRLRSVDDQSVESSYLEGVEHLVFGPLESLVKLTLLSAQTGQLYDVTVQRHVPIRVWERLRRSYEIMDHFRGSDLMARHQIVEVLEGLRLHIGDGSFNTNDLLKDHRHNRSTLGIVLRMGNNNRSLNQSASSASSLLADNLRAVQGITKGGPAHISGALRIGDEVIAVDGRFVDDTDVVEAMRGEDVIGSKTSITVRRGDDTFDVSLIRASAAAVRFCEQLFSFIEALDMQIRSGAPQQTLLSCVQVLAEHGIDMERDRLDREAATAQRLRELQESIFADVTIAESMLYPPAQNAAYTPIEIFRQEPEQAAQAQMPERKVVQRETEGADMAAPIMASPTTMLPVSPTSPGSTAAQERASVASEKASELAAENLQLKKELAMWKAKAEAMVVHDTELEMENEVDEELIEKLKAALADAKRTIAGLRSEHDFEVTERERFQDENAKFKSKNDELLHENDTLSDEVDSLKRQLSSLRRELQTSTDTLQQTKLDLAATQEEEHQHDAHHEEVEKHLHEEIEHDHDEMSKLQARMQSEHERECATFKKQIAASEGEAAEEREQAQLLRDKVVKLQQSVKTLRGELDAIQVQISQEMVTRTQWMASVTETKKAKLEADAKGEEVKRLTYELDAMQKKVSSLEHDIKSERKAHDVHKKEMQEIKSLLACAGVQDPVPELDTINDELAGPPAISLMDLLPIVHAMRKQPQRSVNDVRRIIDIMNEEAAWTVEELAKIKKAVGSGTAYDAALAATQILREDKAALEKDIRMLQKRMQDLEDALEKSEREQARLKEIADLLQSSKSALDGQIVTLKDRISDLEESRRQMLARLEAASEEAARLKAQVAKMEKQIDACATPSLCAPGQTFTGELSLALSSPVNDAVIFYTLDGSEPSPANHAGKGPSPVLVMLRDSAKVSAVAVTNDGQNFSQVQSDQFTYKHPAPPVTLVSKNVPRTLAGVGMLVQKVTGDPNVYVKRLVPGTPSEACGLIAVGDQIVAVDDTSVFGMDLDRIFLLVLGEEGTEIKFEMLKEGLPLTVILRRAHNMDSQFQSRVSYIPSRDAPPNNGFQAPPPPPPVQSMKQSRLSEYTEGGVTAPLYGSIPQQRSNGLASMPMNSNRGAGPITTRGTFASFN